MAKQSTFGGTNGSQHPLLTKQLAPLTALVTSLWSPPSLIKIQSDGKLTLSREPSSLLKLTPFLAFHLAIPFGKTSLYGWGTREGSSWLGVHTMWPSQWSRQTIREKAQLVTLGLHYGRRCGTSTSPKRLEYFLGGHA